MLPVRVQYFQAFTTPALAFLAATIAFGQWYLASRKIALDLFDKRLASADQLKTAVAALCLYGTEKKEDLNNLDQAIYDSQFLFGKDVRDYLQNLRKTALAKARLAMSGETKFRHVAIVVAVLLSCYTFATNIAVADEQKKVMVNGKLLEIYSGSPPIVVIGDKVVLRPPEITAYLNVEGIYEGVDSTYVLVSEGTGGAACPASFAIIELQGPKTTVSQEFGTCSDIAKAEAKGDSLVVTIPKFDGTGEEITTFRKGRLTTVEKIDSQDGEGPVRAPGGNLALLVSNKYPSEAMGLKAFVNALKKIMPPIDFAEARKLALSGVSGPFTMQQDLALASACERHNCGEHSFNVAIDQTGQAWAALYSEGKARFFGDPDPFTKRLLDPSAKQ